MKFIGTHRLRVLSLALGLALCLGLFAGCASRKDEPSDEPSDQVSESPVQSPSPETEETPGAEAPGESSGGSDETGGAAEAETGLRNVVGKVTGIDGSAVTVTICTADTEEEIENYSKVDMSRYTATEETEEVDLTGAMIALAGSDGLTQSEISQIKEGDMLLLSYSGDPGTLLQAIIYAA